MPSPAAIRVPDSIRELRSTESAAVRGEPASAAKPVGATPKAPPGIEAMVGALTARYDKNADAKVSLSELSSVLNPNARFARVDKALGNLVESLDSSKDGAVDSAEWATALGRLDVNADGAVSRQDLRQGADALAVVAGAVPAAPRSIESIVGAFTTRFDKNADARVSLAELAAVLNPDARFPRVEKLLGNVIQWFDTVKDGFIDSAELTKAVARLDANGDGAISRQDLHQGTHTLIALVGTLPHPEPLAGS